MRDEELSICLGTVALAFPSPEMRGALRLRSTASSSDDGAGTELPAQCFPSSLPSMGLAKSGCAASELPAPSKPPVPSHVGAGVLSPGRMDGKLQQLTLLKSRPSSGVF